MNKIVLNLCITSLLMIGFYGYSQNERIVERGDRHQNNSETSYSFRGETYSFSKSNGTFIPLGRGAISLNNGEYWIEKPDYLMPIGFTFTFFEEAFDSLFVQDNGVNLDYDYVYYIDGFYAELVHRDTLKQKSPIAYELTGTTPDQILKIEWKNAGFYKEFDSIGTTNDYINYQIWLYEGSNDIEIHIGPNSVTDANIAYFYTSGYGPYIGLWNDNDKSQNYYLSGDPSNPISVLGDTDVSLNGTPSDGSIYKFSTEKNSIENDEAIEIKLNIFPNPVFEHLKVQVTNSAYPIEYLAILNSTGEFIYEVLLDDTNSHEINTSNYTSGIYVVLIKNETGTLIKRFMKR